MLNLKKLTSKYLFLKAMKYFSIGVIFSLLSSSLIAQNLTNTQIQEFVNQHNYWRKKVFVPYVTWSNKLANYSQEWANHLANNGCGLSHRPSSQQLYGENIYWSSTSARTVPSIVDNWAEERKKCSLSPNTGINSFGGIGHYTQIIWSTTTQIGCGIAICPNGAMICVCNYSPAGNYVGRSPLEHQNENIDYDNNKKNTNNEDNSINDEVTEDEVIPSNNDNTTKKERTGQYRLALGLGGKITYPYGNINQSSVEFNSDALFDQYTLLIGYNYGHRKKSYNTFGIFGSITQMSNDIFLNTNNLSTNPDINNSHNDILYYKGEIGFIFKRCFRISVGGKYFKTTSILSEDTNTSILPTLTSGFYIPIKLFRIKFLGNISSNENIDEFYFFPSIGLSVQFGLIKRKK